MRRSGIVYWVVLGLGDCGRCLLIGVSVSCAHSWGGSLNEVKFGRSYFS